MSNKEHLLLDDDSAKGPSERTAERAAALQRVIAELLPLRSEDRQTILDTVSTFFGIETGHAPAYFPGQTRGTVAPTSRTPEFQFSEESNIPSVKEFLFEKSPKTDVERVACLAYYLAKFRQTPHVKTKDITSLNTESAHRPFSNTAVAVDNAKKAGYIVPSIKWSKQISALGERFVQTLPDRDAARSIFEQGRRRKSASAKKLSEV